MKNRILALLLLIGLVAALAMPASAQTSAKNIRAFKSTTIAVAPSTVTNITDILSLRNAKNTMTQSTFAGSGAGTDNVTFWFWAVPDGTNALTAGAAYTLMQVAANGTTAVTAGTNLLASVWDGVSGVKCSISNASGSRTIYVTNVYLINSN